MKNLKILFFASVAAVTFFIAGCAKDKNTDITLSGKAYSLQLPIGDTQTMSLKVPEEYGIVSSDNFTYWELSNDVTVYLSEILNHLPTDKTDISNLYINSKSLSYDYQSKTITVRCEKDTQDIFKRVLLDGQIYDTDVSLPGIVELSKLPKSTDVMMTLYDNNLYMPEGAQETKLDIYKALLHLNGRDFLLSWIQDGKFEEVRDKIINICLMNSDNDTVQSWYQNNEIFYAQSGNNVVGMKKLRANEWYIYSGTLPYNDYVITGLKKVHGGK